MTELDKLKRARMYMEKLANGVNPLDDRPVHEEDVVNQVRLSRCFFYVADVLGREIARMEHGVQPEDPWTAPVPQEPPARRSRADKPPFALSYYKRAEFQYSPEPISVTELTKRINELAADESRKKLTHNNIRDWLQLMELLAPVKDREGNNKYLPTPAGEGIGMLTVEREGQKGTYSAVLYNRDAQQFIMDNLDAIIEFQAEKKEMKGERWDAEQDNRLIAMYRQGTPVKEMAWQLQRTNGAIRSRMKKLGLEE